MSRHKSGRQIGVAVTARGDAGRGWDREAFASNLDDEIDYWFHNKPKVRGRTDETVQDEVLATERILGPS